MDLGLKDKVVVVTGASKGIGLATARLLLQEGAKVAICSVTESHLREAEQELSRLGGGSIVNISSLGGRCPTTGAATLYGPLKAATNMLSVTMGGEYAAYGVRVNTVMPGYIMTEFNTDHTTDENMKHICAGTLLQRPGQVDEVAMPIVFMCGKGSTFMTGASVEVSGGRGITLNPDYSFRQREKKKD